LSPDKLFARSWALTVLECTMDRLGAEAARTKKAELFEKLRVYLTADKHRLRRRYRECLRDEIAQTVTTEDQIDQEIRDLFAALAR